VNGIEVRIEHEWYRGRGGEKRLIVLGSAYPGAPRGWLKADGTWEPLKEAMTQPTDIGFLLPPGVLEAIVAAAGDVAPEPATERHLQDAITVRDRLLTLAEKAAE
jgi:hypothetical protein